MKKILVIHFMIFVACNSFNNEKKADDEITENELKEKLIGKWSGLGQKNPVWEITKDTFYYRVSSKAFSYEVIGNDVFVNRPDYPVILNDVRILNDTLIFYDSASSMEIKGYRIK